MGHPLPFEGLAVSEGVAVAAAVVVLMENLVDLAGLIHSYRPSCFPWRLAVQLLKILAHDLEEVLLHLDVLVEAAS